MSKILKFPASTNLSPDQALHSSLSENLNQVLIIGLYKDGDLFIRSSKLDRKSALWMIKKAEKHCMED